MPDARTSIGTPDGRRLRIREKGVACWQWQWKQLCSHNSEWGVGQGRPFEYGDGNLSRLMQMRLDAHRTYRIASRPPIVQSNDGLTFAFASAARRVKTGHGSRSRIKLSLIFARKDRFGRACSNCRAQMQNSVFHSAGEKTQRHRYCVIPDATPLQQPRRRPKIGLIYAAQCPN